jgi:peptide/nickel transport system ATP-binding protein
MAAEKIPLVVVEKVSLFIGGNQILRDLSFSIGNQEILAIVGESGSGKSMTALSLIGLQPSRAVIKANKMRIDSYDLMTLNSREWQKLRANTLGMVFQEPQSSLNPSMRCGKQLHEALKIHRQINLKYSKELIVKSLKDVKLNDTDRILKSYPHELSGGQKQREIESFYSNID